MISSNSCDTQYSAPPSVCRRRVHNSQCTVCNTSDPSVHEPKLPRLKTLVHFCVVILNTLNVCVSGHNIMYDLVVVPLLMKTLHDDFTRY